MIREELKKLYIKHLGLILTLLLIVGEIIFVNYLYPKRTFTSDITERHFYEYMEKFSGKLTPEKGAAIIEEQERIVDARNAASAIENQLLHGGYSSEDEFVAEYEKNRLVTERKEAFDLVFKQYSYALDAPDERYMTVGDYSGLCADFPDVLLLALVIFLTAVLFLNEESSGVITFVRISTNGKQRTLCGKLAAISVFILSAQIFRTALEFFVMISRGDIRELSYPIRTLEFFRDSPYNITILQGFLTISTLRLLGYFFIAALIILLSVTLCKALFTIFIPSAVCLLQQFAFDPATPAYYTPTGFLRCVGYLRGDVVTTNYLGDEITLFSRIPLAVLIVLVVFTVIFIAVSVTAAYNYYTCGAFRLPKRLLTAAAVFSICVVISGCSPVSKRAVTYNYAESVHFAQNDDFFFVASLEGITRVSKNDDLELPLIIEPSVGNERSYFCRDVVYDNDSLYFMSSDIYRIPLSDYGVNKVYSMSYNESAGFMEINLSKRPEKGNSGVTVGFFTDGKTYYCIQTDGIIKDGKRIIDENFHLNSVSFDGRRIYYINSLLQLKCYDIKSGVTTRLPGEFVRALYYDGTRILYSDINGIFSLDPVDNTTEKISDHTAEQLTSDGERIIYKNGGKLYLSDDTPIELYDGRFEAFAIISGTNKLAVVQYTGEYELLELLN